MKRTVGIGLMCLFLSFAAMAGEGIPMGNAIFYPSVEALYTHTDNLFLRFENDDFGNESDDFWMFKPALGFEFPFQESYTRFDLVYLYRDYDDFDTSHHSSWYGDLISEISFSNKVKLRINDHYVRGQNELSQVDPGYESTFGDAQFDRNQFQLEVSIPINVRNTFRVFGEHNMVDFDNDDDFQSFYGYDQFSGGFGWKYHMDPASSLTAEYRYLTSDPDDVNQADLVFYTDPRKKYREHQFKIGWEGDLNRWMAGFARAGYKTMNFRENGYDEFSGVIADAGLNFKLTDFMTIDTNLERQAYQSAYGNNNYYTVLGGAVQVHHQVTRHLFYTVGYKYQRNKYHESGFYGYDPLVFTYSPMQYAMGEQQRRDSINRTYAEVGYHFTQQFSLRVNYRIEDRNSSIHYIDALGRYQEPFSYEENRLIVQALLGW